MDSPVLDHNETQKLQYNIDRGNNGDIPVIFWV